MIAVVGMRRSGTHAIGAWIASMAGTEFQAEWNGVDEVDSGVVGLLWDGASIKGVRDRIIRCLARLQPSRIVIVLREPRNHLASLFKSARITGGRRWAWEWKELARSAMGEPGSFLDGIHAKRVVLFDRWVADAQYRADFAAELRLSESEESEKARQTVQWPGSSFQKGESDAEKLDVLGRAGSLRDKAMYQVILRMNGVPEIAQRIFGPWPEDWLRMPDVMGVQEIEEIFDRDPIKVADGKLHPKAGLEV